MLSPGINPRDYILYWQPQPQQPQPQPLNFGWTCPRCGTVHAPSVLSCSCGVNPPYITYSGTGTGDAPITNFTITNIPVWSPVEDDDDDDDEGLVGAPI